MKNFVKGMDKTGHGFEYVRNKFRNVSDTKIKEGIFIGPQIRELMQDKLFDEDLNETERNAWLSFKRICKDFLGNHKAANYQDVVQDPLTSYSDEHGERFHQDIMVMEKRYQGKYTLSMLADYCWTLKMDVPDTKYWQKSYTSTY